MQTSQSVQSLCDNAPKKVLLADGGSSVNTLGFLLQWMSFCFAAVFLILASCLSHLKGKCMTKLMKVCIGNNQHYTNTNGRLRKSFEVMNELELALFTCSTVWFRSLKELSKFQLATKCQSMKEQYQFTVCLLVKNKLNLSDSIRINLF